MNGLFTNEVLITSYESGTLIVKEWKFRFCVSFINYFLLYLRFIFFFFLLYLLFRVIFNSVYLIC